MIRFIITVLFVVSFLILSLPILFVLWLIGMKWPRAKDKASRCIIYWAFSVVKWIAGTKLIVIGKENIPTNQAVLYVGNHRSYFDIILSYLAVPSMTGYIAKKEMNRYPSLRKWMKFIGCLFLDREDIRQGMQMILDAVQKIKSGISIFIFPEGTRNKSDDEFLPFKGGSLKIGEKSGCPVVPVSINHSDDIFEKHLPKICKATVVIEFAKPIDSSSLSKEEKRALSDNVFSQIKAMYEKNKTLPVD